MKATDLLEKQHRKVESLFKKLESGRSDPANVLVQLATDLAAHMVIEQEIFYPAARRVKQDLVLESYEEHAVAQFALKRLLATDPDHDTFQAKVVTLKELIEHHVEEEESELFPKLEKALGAEQLSTLGKQMKIRFDEVVEAGYEAALAKTKSPKRTAIANSGRASK
jgi:hemerythrin-like domain-containing protein